MKMDSNESRTINSIKGLEQPIVGKQSITSVSISDHEHDILGQCDDTSIVTIFWIVVIILIQNTGDRLNGQILMDILFKLM